MPKVAKPFSVYSTVAHIQHGKRRLPAYQQLCVWTADFVQAHVNRSAQEPTRAFARKRVIAG